MPKNKKVALQRPPEGADAAGQPLDDWATVANVWADIRDISGREFVSADGGRSEVTTRIRIWRRSDVTSAMRVLAGAVVYQIQAVLDEGADTTLLLCKRSS